ncbi:allantoinase [Paenibacillus sp. ATY16]|uniref:allantoinase n=1 Tax=Paenibacillus sp. ATY16 TaxID=1759312 RepID=UPI00200CB661|nr:allantoinase [Paenibacillus sp. ATY16]MCK9861397.1 allantoinase [Paenibacillus sp. ATY16]
MNQEYDRIILNGQVVLPGGTYRLDIGIIGGKIAAISESLADSPADEMVDAEGKFVLPGMIDIHVHFNEPNFGHWEGFATGSSALAAGGCTTYADMPLNGNPPTVTPEALALKGELANGKSVVDYTFWGGLVPGKLDQLEKLAEEGVRGFKAFMSNPGGEGEGRFREVDDLTLYEGMKKIAALGGFVALHAESDAITSALAEQAILQGRTDARAFTASRPVIAELEAVNKAILFSEQTGCEVHFVHISSVEAVELIDRAKKRGIPVTVETCPHYLLLTDEDMAEIGPAAKCAPPLRGKEQKEGLWRLLAAGKLDVIASDHSPCPPELKFDESLSFFEAWGGIAGAQSSLELMLDEGFIKRGIPLHKLVELLSAGPAKRFGLYPQKGQIAVGADADLVLVDASRSYTLMEDQLWQRHKVSPYLGRKFACKVTTTLVRGITVYTEEQGVNPVKQGQLLLQPVHAPQQTP